MPHTSRSASSLAPLALLCLSLLCSGLSPSPSRAVDIVWDNGGATNLWDVDANWDGDVQPTAADAAIFGNAGPAEVDSDEEVEGVTIRPAGELSLLSGATLSVGVGGLSNANVLRVGEGGAGPATLRFSAAAEINGGGQIVVEDSAVGGVDGLIDAEGGQVTHGADHTIRGVGTLSGDWLNRGLIEAVDGPGQTGGGLLLTSANIVNEAVVRSSASAELRIDTVTLQNQDDGQGGAGRIEAAGSDVQLLGQNNLAGGAFDATGGAVYRQLNGSTTLDGVALNADYRIDAPAIDTTLSLAAGGVVNEAVIRLTAGAGAAVLNAAEPATISGAGTLELAGGAAEARVTSDDGATLTNAAGHTIRGVGVIEGDLVNDGEILVAAIGGDTLTLAGSVVNNGLISTEQNAGTTILVTGAVANRNILRARPGTTIRITETGSVSQMNSGDRLIAFNDAVIELAGGLIDNGRVQTTGSGRVEVTEDSTINDGELTAPININPGKTLLITGGELFNTGVITAAVDPGPGDEGETGDGPLAATFSLGNDVTLSGDGEIVLEGVMEGRAAIDTGVHTLIQPAGHTIRGAGEVRGQIVNNGRLQGDGVDSPLVVAGRLSGVGSLADVLVTGVHAPGESPAVVPLEESYTLGDDAQLEIEIGGLTPGVDHDQLDSTGDVLLGGDLLVELIDGFAPTDGDAFTIITAASVSGAFENGPETLPMLAEGLEWLIDVTATDVVLRVAGDVIDPPEPTGDYDFDLFVNAADYAVWRDGASPDGGTTEEYAAWVENFGDGPPAPQVAVAAAPIPEPSAAALLMAAGVVVARRRR